MENIMKRFLSLTLALLLVFSLMPQITLGASAVNMTGGEKLYMKPSSNWLEASAWFAAYFCNGSSSAEWIKMADTDADGVYEVTVPSGRNHKNVIFCRMNPASSTMDWNNKWNQTADLTYDGAKNCYNVSGWDSGSWGTYTYVEPVFTVVGSAGLCGTEWDVNNSDNDMTKGGPNWSKTYEGIAKGTYEFKVVRNHSFNSAWPSSNATAKVTYTKATVTIIFNGSDTWATYTCEHGGETTTTSQASTCTKAGTEWKKCADCNEVVKTTELPLAAHNYSDGACTACGAIDPDSPAPEINGNLFNSQAHIAEFACENRAAYMAPNDSACSFAAVVLDQEANVWTCDITVDLTNKGAYYENSLNNLHTGYTHTAPEIPASITITAIWDDENGEWTIGEYPTYTFTCTEIVEEPECQHDWSKKDGVCAKGCGTACDHNDNSAPEYPCWGDTCLICGKKIAEGSHNWVDGTCTNGCGTECEHNFDDNAETCSICGAENPDYVPTPTTMTIYFQNNWFWSDVSVYYWGASDGTDPGWHGYAMELAGNDGYYDIYTYEIPTDITGMIINGVKDDGSGDRDQTPDITEGFYDGICYYMMWNDGNTVGSEDISVIAPNLGGSTDPEDPAEPFVIEKTNMRFGSDLSLLFAFDHENVPDLNSVYAEITRVKNGTEQAPIIIGTDKWTTITIEDVRYYVVEFDGIAGKEMTDEVTVVIRDAEGNALSEALTTSIRTYAMGILGKTANDEYKTAIVDMLNYGTAAQVYFDNYNSTEPANGLLSDEQKNLASAAGIYTDQREKDEAYFGGSNLRFTGKINLLFRMNVSRDTYAVFTWKDHNGKDHSVRVDGSEYETSSGMLTMEVEGLVVADARQKVTCTIYNSSDDSVVTKVIDSVESNVARRSEKTAELYLSFMKFADSAYAYMH